MITALIYLLVSILVIGIVIGLVLWVNDAIPTPEPFHHIIRIIAIVVGVLVIILALLNFIGIGGPLPFPRH